MIMAKNINLLPATKEQLQEIFTEIIQPTFKDISINLLTFKGSGISAGMKYVMRNRKKYKGFDQTALFFFIDLSHFSENPNQIAAEAVTFSMETATIDSKKVIKQLSPDDLTLPNFIELIRAITYDKKHKAVFIIESPEYLHKKHYAKKEILSWVKSLGAVNPMNSAFIFLSKAEDTKHDIGQLSTHFHQKRLEGNKLLLSMDSSIQGIKTQEKWYKEEINEDFAQRIISASLHDPSVIRATIKKGIADPNFIVSVNKSTDTKDLYSLIGKKFLNNRYYQIVKYLEKDSLLQLINLEEPTYYLDTSGLINGKKYLNPLFEFFCKNYLEELIPGIVNQIDHEVITNIKSSLSGLELGVFNLLFKHLGQIVPRDDIADVMWGNQWTHKYSDQAIDKLASNLRKKLSTEGLNLKSAKGTGFILSQD